MKVGLNMWAFAPDDSIETAMQTVRDAGFDGVELNLGRIGWVTERTSNEELDRVRELAEKNHLEIPSVCSSLYWKYALTSDCEEDRKKAVENLRLQIRIANRLGAHAILSIPGFVGCDFSIDKLFRGVDELQSSLQNQVVDYSVAYERAKRSLLEVADEANRCNVHVCLENVGNRFLLSPLEMKRFLADLKDPAFLSYFDVGNIHAIGYPEHWIRALGDRIGMIHIKDFDKRCGEFVKIGSGSLNLSSVIVELKRVKYDGWLIAEYIDPLCWRKENYLLDTANHIKKTIRGGLL